MNPLKQKKIVLAVTGSIACYKSLFLTRLLIKAGAEVRVIMTPSATKFVAPLTFSTLSKHPVYTSVIDEEAWNNHVELGLWGDLMLIAPCTASSLGKMANGIADTIVTAVYLSAKCPVWFAPAMDRDMWTHPSTQENIRKLTSYGNKIIPVGNGELASGLVGAGRMAEPEDIITALSKLFTTQQDLAGKKVVITAGPTQESLDPVRFLGNHSSGKMGIELADVCAGRGAEVTLVLGPSVLRPEYPGIKLVSVRSAEDMYNAAVEAFSSSDIAIMAAAVADYRPKTYSDIKIKKKQGEMTIELERTKDIAAHLGSIKKSHQLTIGFALETTNEEANAKRKLEKKNFDMIVLNSLKDKGAGFQHNTNKVKIINTKGDVIDYELKSKRAVAEDIVNQIVEFQK